MLIYDPIEDTYWGNLAALSSNNAYEIGRIYKHKDKTEKRTLIKTFCHRNSSFYFIPRIGMRIYKTPYNVKTVKNLIKKILL